MSGKQLTFLPFNIGLTLTFERLKKLHRFFSCPVIDMNLSVFIPFGYNEVRHQVRGSQLYLVSIYF